MKVISILVVCVVLHKCVDVDASISIDIEPEELERIAAILVESYISQNVRPHPHQIASLKRNILLWLKKASSTFIPLVGITSSLVAANLLTTWFQSPHNVEIIETPLIQNVSFATENSFMQSENTTPLQILDICKREYGCHDYICWRTCGVQEQNKTSWCFIAPKPGNYQ